jgi:hypothetical protein
MGLVLAGADDFDRLRGGAVFAEGTDVTGATTVGVNTAALGSSVLFSTETKEGSTAEESDFVLSAGLTARLKSVEGPAEETGFGFTNNSLGSRSGSTLGIDSR